MWNKCQFYGFNIYHTVNYADKEYVKKKVGHRWKFWATGDRKPLPYSQFWASFKLSERVVLLCTWPDIYTIFSYVEKLYQFNFFCVVKLVVWVYKNGNEDRFVTKMIEYGRFSAVNPTFIYTTKTWRYNIAIWQKYIKIMLN